MKLPKVLLVLASCGVFPLYALTDGPKQPEYQTYIPVDIKDVVNLSTGDLSYSIDLLEVPTADGRGYPVNVHYMSGIGTNQEASWVGLGWNLNVGSISRSLVNYPDEYKNHKVTKRGNSVTQTQQATTLFTPYASVTYSHSEYGRGQLSYALSAAFSSEEPEDAMESSTAEKNSFSFEGQFGISGNLGGAEAPEGSGSRTFINWGGTIWGAINGFGIAHDWINTTTKKDFNLYQYGYLWKDALSLPEWPTLETFNGSEAKLQDAYNMNTIQCAWDVTGASPPANTSFDWPSLTSDIFSIAGYGITGQFRARPKNGETMEEYVPANRLGLTGQAGYFNESSAIMSFAYVDRHRKVPENYGFYFEDDPAGTVHTASQWPYQGEFEPPPNNLEKPQSKKVIPHFNSDFTQLLGFTVVNEQGITYEFKKPVYSYAEYTEMSNNPGAAHAGDYTTYFTPEGTGEIIGAANSLALSAMESLQDPLYAVDFLLTAIKGPDYVDNVSGGVFGQPDDADGGYWVQFKYQDVTNSYIYRTPFQGKATASMYDQARDDKELKYTFSYGRKDLVYLRNIITNQSVAVFDIKKREDGVESGELALGGIGTGSAARMESYYRLGSIQLFNKRDMFSPGTDGIYEITDAIEGDPIKMVVFGHDYELAQGTPNSNAGGKLTLQKIQIFGKGGTKLPPYQFNYGFNPNYSPHHWDRWGFYKSDGAAAPTGFLEFPNHQGIRQGDAKAWSMTSIELPSRGKLVIEYENDEYNTIQERPIGTTIPNVNAWDNGRSGVLPGKAFWEDGLEESDFPREVGAYEIRSYAPGFVPSGDWESDWDTDGSKYDYLRIHSTYIDRLTTSNSGNVVRRTRIYREEFPQNFNLSWVEVYAHGEGDPALGCDVRGWIEMVATSDDNSTVHLNPGFSTTIMNSPQWISAASTAPILTSYKYIDIEFRAKETGFCFDFSSSINQRDFRVFLREANGSTTALNIRKKLGGGIRVKKIDIIDPMFQKTISKTYTYDDGSGGSSGSATQEPAPFNSGNNDDRILAQHAWSNLISTEKVFYSKVKVQTSGTGSIEYDFHTPRDKYVDLKFPDDDVTYPGLIEDDAARATNITFWTQFYATNHGLHFKHDGWTAIDNQKWWGLPKAITVKDESGSSVMRSEKKYSISRDFSNMYEASVTDFIRTKDVHNHGSYFQFAKMNTLTVVSYVPKLVEITSIKDKFSVTEKFAYNKINGQVNSVSKEYRHTAGATPKQVRTTRKTFAFEKSDKGIPYNSMGHRDANPDYSHACAGCKNMLTQVAEEYVTWDNGDGSTGEKYVKADIYPWRSYNSGQVYKEGRFQWRAENEGISTKPAFPWSSLPWNSNDPAWVKNHRILKYDSFEHPVEVEDATGVAHASVYGYGDHLQIGYLSGLGFAEASVFTGDYDTGEDPEYFDRYNGWSKGNLPGGISEISSNGHFGKKSIHVVNAYGPVKDVILAGGARKAYTLSAWIQSISGSCLLYIDQRKPGTSFPEVVPGSTPVALQISAADRVWKKYEVEIPVGIYHSETQILRAHVGCPSGGEAYIDEIRFAPTAANLQTVFYDPELRLPLAILDENGVPEYYEYDGLGRLTGVRNAEGSLKGERAFVQDFEKPAFAFSPIQIIWDGTPNVCHDEFAKHLTFAGHDYEIMSSSNPTQIAVDPTKKKVCPIAVDADGKVSAQFVIKSLLTGETVTVPADVHGPHFVALNMSQKIECVVRPEPGVMQNCLFNWSSLHEAANLDVAKIVSYKMELSMMGVNFETYSWLKEAFPFATNSDYRPQHGAHIYFGWQDGYQGTNECLKYQSDPICVTNITRPAFVRASGFIHSDNIGLLLPDDPVWGSGLYPNYQGPWNFTQQFEWPSKYFLNPPHFHNSWPFTKAPYSLYVSLYGWSSVASWRPITLHFQTSMKLVGATVVDKF